MSVAVLSVFHPLKRRQNCLISLAILLVSGRWRYVSFGELQACPGRFTIVRSTVYFVLQEQSLAVGELGGFFNRLFIFWLRSCGWVEKRARPYSTERPAVKMSAIKISREHWKNLLAEYDDNSHAMRRLVRIFTSTGSAVSEKTCPFSSDHPVRSRQDVGWNGEADLLCGFEIDHQLEFS